MLRALSALLLSFAASTAILGLFLTATPPGSAKILPALLMFFPLWICVGSAAYFFPTKKAAAASLFTVTGVGFGLMAIMKFFGLAGI